MCNKCPKEYNKMQGESTGSKIFKMALLVAGVQTYKNCSCACDPSDLQVSQVAPQSRPMTSTGTPAGSAQIDTVAYCKKCNHSFIQGIMTIS